MLGRRALELAVFVYLSWALLNYVWLRSRLRPAHSGTSSMRPGVRSDIDRHLSAVSHRRSDAGATTALSGDPSAMSQHRSEAGATAAIVRDQPAATSNGAFPRTSVASTDSRSTTAAPATANIVTATTAASPTTSAEAAATAAAAISPAAPSSTTAAPFTTPRPNILFIVSDDHSAEAVGFRAGARLGALAETTNLNLLAAQGAVIEDSFVVLSLCSPSRATILTGRYPHQHGVTGLNGRVSSSARTYVSMLRDEGYRTGIVGKV